jgi:thiol-activated cytolysin/VCBS repeat protein
MKSDRRRQDALRRTCLTTGLVLAAAASSLGCGGSSDPDGVDVYMKSLPTWAEFSPELPDVDPHAVGQAGPTENRTVGTRQFICQTTPFAIQRTPRELVMYSPNVEILWPGSLLQGRSYKEGDDLNALLALTVAERTPIKVSIPALKTADNFREVVPDQATVSQAIGAMLGAATEADLRTPSSIWYDMQSYHSEEQFALQMGVSGRYMGFSAKASFSYDQTAEETTVVMHFVEKMFEVVVAPPQTPRAFFSPAFTQAKLDEQIQLGRIGPDNLPIYVSNVVYGRMFTFTMTSTKSEQEIRAALQAAYSFGVGDVQADLSAEQRSLIQASRISIASVGGDAQATIDVIRSGDWRAYFTSTSSLASATPLSYTFRSLADGTVALVTETTSYDRTVCDPLLTSGFLAVQSVQPQLTTPFTASAGDLNGDGRLDLVWNHLGTTNAVRVGFGKTDGTFDMATASVVTVPVSPAGGWTAFKLVVADMNGDGKDDLAWNRVASGTSDTLVALSRGDGTFDAQPFHTRAEAEWATPGFAVMAARVRAKAAQPPPRDLLWSRLTGTGNLAVASVWGGGAPVDLAPQALASPAGGWAPFAGFGAMLGDVDGDGVDDLVYGKAGGACAAVNDGAGVFVMKPAFGAAMPCGYQCPTERLFRLADVNGDGLADVLRYERDYVSWRYCPRGCTETMCNWGDSIGGACRRTYYHNAMTQLLVSDGLGGFAAVGAQNAWPVRAVDPYLRDVSGDGKADLVWITLAGEARVSVAVAETTAEGAFVGFTAVPDRQPLTALPPGAANWSAFRALFGDVNGDGKVDVVLNDSNVVGSVYVYIR